MVSCEQIRFSILSVKNNLYKCCGINFPRGINFLRPLYLQVATQGQYHQILLNLPPLLSILVNTVYQSLYNCKKKASSIMHRGLTFSCYTWVHLLHFLYQTSIGVQSSHSFIMIFFSSLLFVKRRLGEELYKIFILLEIPGRQRLSICSIF